jgi:hypothetical protein
VIHTLGEFIETLDGLPADKPVRFQHGDAPRAFVSWRGDYRQLTLTGGMARECPTVAQLRALAVTADGATFTGYKGGEFTMGRHTALYADKWGEYFEHRIEAVIEDECHVVLITDAQAWLDS